jgi:hypothetical protein
MAGNVSTRIEIFSNLSYPLDNSHVRRFDNLVNQTAFFDSRVKAWVGENYKYNRVDNYEFELLIKGSIKNTQQLGYARIKNIFDGDKWYYCFINKVVYVDDLTVKLQLTLDFYQTYCFDMNILPSYVERHHTRLYNPDGSPVINTTEENLDYGKQYRIVNNSEVKYTEIYMLGIISTKQLGDTTSLPTDKYVGLPTPLYYYYIPYTLNENKAIQVKWANKTRYVPLLIEIFKQLQTSSEIVNSIVSLYTTLYTGVDFNSVYHKDTGILDLDSLDEKTQEGLIVESFKIVSADDASLIRIANIKQFKDIEIFKLNKYSGVPNYVESKLKMSPYTIITMTDLKGNQMDIEPEFISDMDMKIRARGSAGTQNKIGYYISNYLVNQNNVNDASSYLHSMIDENPNNAPIVTDAVADYTQGNINSIETKKSLSERNRNVEIATGALNMIPSLFTGAVGAGFGVTSFATGAINAENRHYNDIKTLEAKQKDIENIPPNAKNMGGNASYEWGNRLIFPRMVIKTVTAEKAKKLSDYFGMYGYQVNELTQPNVNTRTKWNYVKCTTLNVQSGMNREIILKFKEIFEKGVTLWHDDDMFNYNRVNEVK